jgi:hypothetical protein
LSVSTRLKPIEHDAHLSVSWAIACRTGTEGTPRCNYGRSCGVLRARGQDVGALLIA